MGAAFERAMDEQTPVVPLDGESTGRPPAAVGPTASPSGPSTPAPRRRRWSGLVGTGLALALAFLWGGLAYRELGPKMTHGSSLAATGVAVAGSEAPPQWIGDFAKAFCAGDAKALADHIGPPLSAQVDQIAQALAQRDWTCTSMRFIGGGMNSKGSFYAYVMEDKQGLEEWWIFTALNDRVVGID